MIKKKDVYKCSLCGNIVEVLHAGAGELVCCGQPMDIMVANSVDAAQEKHVPVIEKVDNGYQVTVGSIAHPMTENHYIEWIELTAGTKTYKQSLGPADAPETFFRVDAETISARAYCNLHGLWQGS